MKNMYRIAGFGLAAGAAVMIAVASPASARGQMGGEQAMGGMMGGQRAGIFALQFSDLDTDGDGLVTEAELTARAEGLAAERLAGVDADGDGAVTAAEIEALILARIGERAGGRMGPGGARAVDPAERAATMAERMIAARDTDDDGALSGAELSPAAEIGALIDRFDTDDDNAWSAEEFAQVSMGRGGFGGRGFMHGPDGHGERDGKRR